MTAKTEDVFQARGPIRLAETEGCTIWQFRNKTGDGTMAAYEVFPGAMVSFTISIWPAMTAATSQTGSAGYRPLPGRGG